MDVSEPVHDPETGHMISSVAAAALCIKPRGLLTDRQARKVDALKEGSTVFVTMRGLAMRFASVLRRDIDAVKNAIELRWSNGQAEGQINRLKMLKRAMYGRAGPELMRARMMPLNHRN